MAPAPTASPMVLASDTVERFDAPPEAVWAAIAAVDRYRSWWPWLHGLDAQGLATGDVWTCRIATPLRLHLAFTITITRVDPPHGVAARLDGDLAGTATIDVEAGDVGAGGARRGASVRLRSQLEPRQPVLRAMTRLVPPVARAAHARLVREAARQFAEGALSAG